MQYSKAERPVVILRILGPIIPYVAVVIGMVLLRSGWAAIGLYHLGICGFVMATRGPKEFKRLLTGWDAPAALAIVPLFAASGVAVHLLWPLARSAESDLSSSLAAFGLHGAAWLAFAVYYSLVNPWLEELMWRGILAEKGYWGWFSDILFAGYHLLVLRFFVEPPWLLLAMVILVLAGTAWRTIMRKCGGLLMCVIAHFVADVSIIGVAYYLSVISPGN